MRAELSRLGNGTYPLTMQVGVGITTGLTKWYMDTLHAFKVG